ncbi:MAG: sulfatase-like hydrolase/transferase [Aeromonas sp.]
MFAVLKKDNDVYVAHSALGTYLAQAKYFWCHEPRLTAQWLSDYTHLSLIELTSEIKQNYNPLLSKQALVLLDEKKNILLQVPCAWLAFVNVSDNLALLAQLRKQAVEQQALLDLLLQFVLTKDLMLINQLIELDKPFDLHLFALIEQFFSAPTFSLVEKIIRLLQQNSMGSAIADSPNVSACPLPPAKIKALSHAALAERKLNLNQSLEQQQHYQAEFKRAINAAVATTKEKKNVVLVHLESLSNKIYQENQHLLPALAQLAAQSLQFRRYYSAATSTVMSMSAVFYGNKYECDRFNTFDECYVRGYYQDSLFHVLQKLGYALGSASLSNGLEINESFINHAIEKELIDFKPVDNFPAFSAQIAQFITAHQDEPFCLFIDNQITHCSIEDQESCSGQTHEDKKELGFVSLNKTIQCIVDELTSRQLLDDTLIVLYGDHGDDKWTREINNGFSHITEPYGSIISTPLIMFDARFAPGMILDDLIGSADLKSTLLYLLGDFEKEILIHQPHRSGINVFKQSNAYVFSNSLFANQNSIEQIQSIDMQMLNNFCDIEYKNKSYAVINHKYNLVVSEKGCELFNLSSDPDNYCNLLNFFAFDANGLATKFLHHGAWRGHFRLEMMSSAQVYQNLLNYYQLRKVLQQHVAYREALVKKLHLENYHLFEDTNFIKPRRHKYN